MTDRANNIRRWVCSDQMQLKARIAITLQRAHRYKQAAPGNQSGNDQKKEE